MAVNIQTDQPKVDPALKALNVPKPSLEKEHEVSRKGVTLGQISLDAGLSWEEMIDRETGARFRISAEGAYRFKNAHLTFYTIDSFDEDLTGRRIGNLSFGRTTVGVGLNTLPFSKGEKKGEESESVHGPLDVIASIRHRTYAPEGEKEAGEGEREVSGTRVQDVALGLRVNLPQTKLYNKLLLDAVVGTGAGAEHISKPEFFLQAEKSVRGTEVEVLLNKVIGEPAGGEVRFVLKPVKEFAGGGALHPYAMAEVEGNKRPTLVAGLTLVRHGARHEEPKHGEHRSDTRDR